MDDKQRNFTELKPKLHYMKSVPELIAESRNYGLLAPSFHSRRAYEVNIKLP